MSPPPESTFGTIRTYQRLRALSYEAARATGFRGGCAVFHDRRMGSKRWNLHALGCRPGPHFHLIGDGWITLPFRVEVSREHVKPELRGEGPTVVSDICPACARERARRLLAYCPECTNDPATHVHGNDPLFWAEHSGFCGWVVKNLGPRRSVRATAKYVLSHAAQGILCRLKPEAVHVEPPRVVTWFGSMAYSKLRIETPEAGSPVCPVCHADIPLASWYRIVWEGTGPPPEGDCGVCAGGRWRAERLEYEDFGGTRVPRRVTRSYDVGGPGEEDLFGGARTRGDVARDRWRENHGESGYE